mgnify:FL=1
MIGLADCNNFYASCERVFKPSLNNKPVVVLSNNDGCVIARSNESKRLGIKMGEPAFKIKSLIKENNVKVFSTNFSLYGDLSKRVMTTLKSEVKSVEVYSIDEAFLDFSDHLNLDRLIYIRNKVKKWTGIPVSIGVAPTKTLAKVANYLAKKQKEKGVFILDDEDLIKKVLKDFSIQDLWGIGRRYSRKLNQLNIYNALQLRNLNTDWLRKKFSINMVRLQKELKGEVSYSFDPNDSIRKSICTSRSFAKEVSDFNVLKEYVSNFAVNCASKLRKQKSYCSKLSLFLMTNRFKSNTKQHYPSITLEFLTPTNDNLEIVTMASRALRSIYSPNFIYKKAGVILHNTVLKKDVQMSLFDQIDRKKRKKLMRSMDYLNNTLGKNKVRVASQGLKENLDFKRNNLSPSYTTKYSDILTIKI